MPRLTVESMTGAQIILDTLETGHMTARAIAAEIDRMGDIGMQRMIFRREVIVIGERGFACIGRGVKVSYREGHSVVVKG